MMAQQIKIALNHTNEVESAFAEQKLSNLKHKKAQPKQGRFFVRGVTLELPHSADPKINGRELLKNQEKALTVFDKEESLRNRYGFLLH